jgi:hypothetical protein
MLDKIEVEILEESILGTSPHRSRIIGLLCVALKHNISQAVLEKKTRELTRATQELEDELALLEVEFGELRRTVIDTQVRVAQAMIDELFPYMVILRRHHAPAAVLLKSVDDGGNIFGVPHVTQLWERYVGEMPFPLTIMNMPTNPLIMTMSINPRLTGTYPGGFLTEVIISARSFVGQGILLRDSTNRDIRATSFVQILLSGTDRMRIVVNMRGWTPQGRRVEACVSCRKGVTLRVLRAIGFL